MAQKKFIIDGGFLVSDDSVIEANLEMGGHILPSVDSDGTTGFDLGSTTAKWRDLYLSQGSLYINNQKVLQDDSGTIIVRADEDQSMTVKTTGTGILTLDSDVSVNFAANLNMIVGAKILGNGDEVVFGDGADMDNNRIINVGTPVNGTDAVNKNYVDQSVTNLVNGAPAALDTLNELANALGDDANFAATLATDIAAINGNISGNTADITTLQADVAAADSDIQALSATSTTHTGAISTAQADITALQAAVATNATDIAANSTAVTNAIATASADATAKANAAQTAAEATANAAIGNLDFNNVSGGIAVTGGDLSVGAGGDFTLSSTSEAAFNGNTIVGEDPDAAGSPALCASSFRPTTGGSNLNLRSANGGAIDLDGGDVTYAGTGIVGDDPDNAGSPTVCASTFRPVSGQADLNLAPGTGGNIALSSDGDVTYGGVGIVGDDADNAGSPAVCASTFRPVSGQTDLNVRPGAGGAVTFGDAVLEGVGTPVAGTDATNKTYVDSAIAAAVSPIDTVTHSHGSPVVVTSTQADATGSVTIDLGVTGLDSYSVYLNRQLLRPTEMTSYNASTGECVFAAGVLSTDDELEIVGFSIG